MLKVAPCAVVPSYGRTSKFFRLDGLLLFCIIMGLRSASSAILRLQVLLRLATLYNVIKICCQAFKIIQNSSKPGGLIETKV